MATTTTYTAQVTMLYTDLETRNINFTEVSETAVDDMKARALEFNAVIAAGGASSTAYKETFQSDNGAPIDRINKAKYTATTEEVIYNGD